MDPVEFLVRHAPFDTLSRSGRERIASSLEITWAIAGQTLIARGAANRWLHVVRKGRVRLALDGQSVVVVGPGELFGVTSLRDQDDDGAILDATAETDCLLYRLDARAVRTLCDAEPRFARFFIDDLARRLRRLSASFAVPLTSDLGRSVGELARREPVTLDLATEPTLGDVARVMQRADVSSVLLIDDVAGSVARPVARPVGIVTDRDLRRSLAESRTVETPARTVMTSPVELLAASTPGAEALLHLLRSGRHHLVLEEEGRLRGVVTHSDLLRRQLQGPGALLEDLRRAESVEALEGFAERVAAVIETLHFGGLEATDVGRVVAALHDALAVKVLDLATRELAAPIGPPPGAHAWIVFGSEGRREQSFLTDQDNALVYESDESEDFERLARRGVEGLLAAGVPACEGGFMATNWCLSLDEWRRRFGRWIDEPEPENLMRVANFFDWRVVHGGLSLEPLEQIVRSARDNRRFIGQLARASMTKRPPLGLLHRVVEDEDGVDLKSGALMPISGLARLLALEAGHREGSTLRRLEEAERHGTLSADGREVLAEAFRFVFGLRLRTQLAARRAGRPLSSSVTLAALTAGERRHLKDAFVAVERMQKATEMRLATGGLG